MEQHKSDLGQKGVPAFSLHRWLPFSSKCGNNNSTTTGKSTPTDPPPPPPLLKIAIYHGMRHEPPLPRTSHPRPTPTVTMCNSLMPNRRAPEGVHASSPRLSPPQRYTTPRTLRRRRRLKRHRRQRPSLTDLGPGRGVQAPRAAVTNQPRGGGWGGRVGEIAPAPRTAEQQGEG